MDQATAHTFHTRLLHQVSDVPTRTGAAMRDTINAHRPLPLTASVAVCAGGALNGDPGTCTAVDYPCSTTKVIAGAYRLEIPTSTAYRA